MSLLSSLIKLLDIGMMGMADALVETVASSSPLRSRRAGSIVFEGRPLASFVRHEFGSLGTARDCFKLPALI